MKKAVLLLLALLVCHPAFGAYAHVGAAVSAQSANNNSVSISYNIAGADLVVCIAAVFNHQPANGELADTLSNTYIADATFHETTSGTWVGTFSSRVGSTGADTITYTFTGSFPALACQAYSGSIASPLDGTPVGAVNASTSSLATGSFTPSGTELCVVGAAWGNDNQTTSYTSYTKLTEQPNAGAEEAVAMADSLSCSGAQNQTVSWTGTVASVAIDLTGYKASGGGGGGSCTTRKLLLGVGPC